MSLTDNEKNFVSANNLCYFYLPPLPFKWNNNFTAVAPTEHRFQSISYFTCILFVWLYGFVFALIGASHLFDPERRAEGISQCVAAGGLLLVPSLILATGRSNLLNGMNTAPYNSALNICNSLLKEFPKQPGRSSTQWMYAFAEMVVLISFPVGALLVSIGRTVTGFDIFGPVLDRYILPDPEYRETDVIVYAYHARLGLTYTFTVECFRSGSTIMFYLFPLVDRLLRIITAFKNSRTLPKFSLYYTSFLLLYASIKNSVFRAGYILISFAFWMVVMLAWTCINCSPEAISFPLYIWFCFAMVILVGAEAVLIPLTCNGIDTLEGILTRYQFRVNYLFAKERTFQAKLEIKKAQALQKFRFSYGFFGDMNRDFVLDYFWAILQRTVDAILTFQ